MRHNIVKFNEYLKANKLARNAAGIFVSFVMLVVLQLPVRFAYYGLMNGNYFLNVKSAKVVYIDPVDGETTQIPQDQEGRFFFAREPRTRVTGFDIVRTFYRVSDGSSALQREIPVKIEYEQSVDSDIVPIKIDQRPDELGEFYFCQVLTFKVNGFTKFADFCTEEFEIVAPSEQ